MDSGSKWACLPIYLAPKLIISSSHDDLHMQVNESWGNCLIWSSQELEVNHRETGANYISTGKLKFSNHIASPNWVYEEKYIAAKEFW